MNQSKVNDIVSLIKDDEEDYEFPEVPEIPDIPEGDVNSFDDEALEILDNFLLKRELWKEKWEHLDDEQREVFEKYINDKVFESFQ